MGKTYLALTSLCSLAWPSGPTGWPSQQAAQPNCQELLPAPASRSCCVAAPQPAVATSPATSYFSLSSPWTPWTSPRATPHCSHSLSLSLLPWFSLSQPPERARRHRSSLS